MIYEVMKVMYKLRVLVTVRIILFIIYPLIEKVGNGIFSPDIFRWIEGCFNLFRLHLSDIGKWEPKLICSVKDELDCALTNAIPGSDISIGETLLSHFKDTNNNCVTLHFVTYNPIILDGDWIYSFLPVITGYLNPSLIYFEKALWICIYFVTALTGMR